MTDKVKLHRRMASLARWEAQQAGADLAKQLARLKQLQQRVEQLVEELESLGREQLAAMADGRVDVQLFEGTGLLARELDATLQQWRAAVARQREQVARSRHALAAAQQKERKTRDKHRESLLDVQLQQRFRESVELEGIYVANFGRNP